jgi:hypothetical protein
MIEGNIIYKKFSDRANMKTSAKVFDPLQGDKFPPD